MERVVRPCRFRWEVSNPFMPWRPIGARFYSGFPRSVQWTAALKPLDRDLDTWKIAFELYPDGEFRREEDVCVRGLHVSISVNSRNVEDKTAECHDFRSGIPYQFQTSIDTTRPHNHFVVQIEMSFLEPRAQPNGLFYKDACLVQLSADMLHLLRNPIHANIEVVSADSHSYPVHDYIILHRCNELLMQWNLASNNRPVIETGISRDLLWEILKYLYSARFNMNRSIILNDLSRRTEVFQVLDRYKMQHLYMVFARSDTQQVRKTTNHLQESFRRYRLHHITTGLPLRPRKLVNRVNPNTEIEFIFTIEFHMLDTEPWFEYKLRFKSPTSLHVRIIVSFERINPGGEILKWRVHERDCTIRSTDLVDSRTGHFEGCDRELADFKAGRNVQGGLVRHYAQVDFELSDGSSSLLVECENREAGHQIPVERLEVLSDHMADLRLSTTTFDLTVKTRTETMHAVEHEHNFHRAIFETRFRQWERGFQVSEEDGHLDCSLPYESFLYVPRCIYTGKTTYYPFSLNRVIDDFARRTDCRALGQVTFARVLEMEGYDFAAGGELTENKLNYSL